MPTGDRKINIYEKRLLERTAINDNFLGFLVDTIDQVTSAIFQGTSGVLDSDEIEITSSANDTFTLDITNASRCVVGGGQIIDLSLLGVALYTNVPFQNTAAVTYNVGIKFAEIADGIEMNPRTGDPEYPKLKQTYGELANPDSVTDHTTYIRLVIDAITDLGSGENHTGRTVRVWLVDPVSGVASTAYFEGTSAYLAGTGNYVDIPYTSPDGPLGQDTGVNPPSTTASDYLVFIEGPTWRNKANKDLSADSNYAFIGEITGNGPGATPVAFNVSGQVPIFINTLDRAYDGATGSGSGRLINVDAEAVEMRSRAGGTDELYAALRVDRKGGTQDAGVCAQFIADQSDGREDCAMHLVPLVHSTGGLVVDNPCSTTNPNIVTRTGAVDWAASNVQPYADLAWLQGFPTSDGLYAITAVAATQLTLMNLDNSALNLTGAETGNVTILRCVQASGTPLYGSAVTPTVSCKGPNAFSGLNEDTAPPSLAAASFFGWESDAIFVWDTQTNPIALVKRSRFSNRGIPYVHGVHCEANPFAFPGASGELIRSLSTPVGDPTQVSSAKLAQVMNHREQEIERWEYLGRRAQTHRQKDDFNYRSTFVSPTTPPPDYDFSGSGASPILATGGLAAPGGWITVGTDTAAPASGQTASLRGQPTYQVKAAGPTNVSALCFFAKIRLDDIAHDPVIRIGFWDSSGSETIYWGCSVGTAVPWTLYSNDGAGGTSSENSTVSPVADADVKLWIAADPFAAAGSGLITGRIEQGANKVQLAGVPFPSSAGRFLNLLGLYVWIETNDGASSVVYIDEWEAWDDVNLRSGDSE